jgi:hypothetical protein
VAFYLDMHAHATKRGCFIYGNALPSLTDQVENQTYAQLLAINSAHFEYNACNFSKQHMERVSIDVCVVCVVFVCYILPSSFLHVAMCKQWVLFQTVQKVVYFVHQTYQMKCDVPMQFEYNHRWMQEMVFLLRVAVEWRCTRPLV